jgi:acyl-CoA dehydrogenase
MDFTVSRRIEDFRARIARFVEDEIMPVEADRAAYDEHGSIRHDFLDSMRDKARGEGLWCLQLKPETGGAGLSKVAMAVCYEEMNRSIFGPVVFNPVAPDDGNKMLLDRNLEKEDRDFWSWGVDSDGLGA